MFVLFSITLGYRCLADYNVGDITFSEFIENRNINEEIIKYAISIVFVFNKNY